MKNPNDVQVEQDWEIYWGAQGEPTSKIYDYIAEFYRKNIIIKILNFFHLIILPVISFTLLVIL